MRRKNLIGQRFGKLVVLSIAQRPESQSRHRYYICKCDCGNIKTIRANHIGRDINSCGCLICKPIDDITRRAQPLYGVWSSMKRRCDLSTYKDYKYYGGKGVIVCDEWKNDYSKFRDWAEKNGYKYNGEVTRGARMSIDRIDPNGNYEPQNCRWITLAENIGRKGAAL